MSELKDRLRAVREFFDLSRDSLAIQIKVKTQNITNYETGRNAPSYTILHSIIKEFPTISARWIMTGEGEMLLGDKQAGVSVNGSVVNESTVGYNNNVGSLEGCKALLEEKDKVIEHLKESLVKAEKDKEFLQSLVKKG